MGQKRRSEIEKDLVLNHVSSGAHFEFFIRDAHEPGGPCLAGLWPQKK